MAAVAHCWAGLLTVGGMVGGSHHQLPLLVIQRPAASRSPPMAWHLENLGLDLTFLGGRGNIELLALTDGKGGPDVCPPVLCGLQCSGWGVAPEELVLLGP